MTNEEAYKWLYVHFAPCGDETKQDEAISIALKAIAKQIPKKPKKEPDRSPLHNKRCPSCNKVLTMYDWQMPHCKCCGQAIDWTEGKC